MADICLPGLQGFPIRVQGFQQQTEKDKLASPNDLILQFTDQTQSFSLNPNDGNIQTGWSSSAPTWALEGAIYELRSVRIAAPTQEGIKQFSDDVLGEFQLWGVRTQNSVQKADVCVLIVPIRNALTTNSFGDTLALMLASESATLAKAFPSGEGAHVLKQVTCVENSASSSTQIAVCQWVNGIGMTQNQLRPIAGTRLVRGVPPIITVGGQSVSLLTRQRPNLIDQKEIKDNREQLKENDYYLIPQSSFAVLATGSEAFLSSFRMIMNWTSIRAASRDTNGQKCIPIDRSRDIKHGQLLVDPRDGRRLTDEVDVAEAQERAATGEDDTEPVDLQRILLILAIIVGVLVGITLIALFVQFVIWPLADRKTMSMAKVAPDVQAIQRLVGPPAGGPPA